MNPFQKENFLAGYRDCGFNLIPLGAGKKPLESWKRWQGERIDVGTLQRWHNRQFISDGGKPWDYSGVVNYAVLTGSCQHAVEGGIVVVDVDDDDARGIAEKYCPATPLTTTTPSGGKHFIYRHPGFKVQQRITTPIGGVVYRLDIKADGNYVVAPGSTTDKGRYVPSALWTPALIALCPVYSPEWIPVDPERHKRPAFSPQDASKARLLLAGVDSDERVNLAKAWLSRQPGAVQGRSSDKYCYALCVKVIHGFGLDAETASDVMGEWGSRDDQQDEFGGWYPWKQSELLHKCQSAEGVQYDFPGDHYVEEVKVFNQWKKERLAKQLIEK